MPPLCPIFGQCGGCAHQHLSYADELALKEDQFRALLTAALPGLPPETFRPIVPSPREYGYRHRLDLSLRRRRDGEIQIGFWNTDHTDILPVHQCPIAMPEVSGFIPELRRQALAKLPPDYRTANLTLRASLDGHTDWGGIGRRSLQRPPAQWLHTEVEGHRILFALDTFFQANFFILPDLARTLRQVLAHAFPHFAAAPPVLLDLYGGVGLFSLLLRDQTEKSILIEDNPASATVAQANADALADPARLQVIQGRVEDHLPRAVADHGPGRLLGMIDPPRAGLSPAARDLLHQHLRHLLYLSCGLDTLARDLADLHSRGWQIHSLTPLDFFPRTPHLETLVALHRP